MSAEIYLDYQHRDDGRPLLWPVWVWTVHVPERKYEGINALARVVLELAASGSDPTEIAQWLGLDAEFIRYIIAAQLVPNDWLDRYSKLTDGGRRLLNDSSSEGLTQRAAYLFQSAENGTLWPRLRGDLQEMEPVDHQAGFPRFQLDRGTGRLLKPFRLRPAQSPPPSAPDAEQVLEALRGDALARHQSRQRGQGFGADDNLPASGIEFIDQTPRLAWVLCRVYRRRVYRRPGARHPWLVSDPLGRTPAADWMRREVYAAAQRVPGLASMLKGLLGETDADESWEDYRDRQDESVRVEIHTAFPRAGSVPGLEPALIDLLSSLDTVRAAGSRARSNEIGQVLIHAQAALEACCLSCLKKWPLQRPQDRLSRNMRNDDLAAALRCAEPGLSEQFIREFKVQPGKVFGALKYRKSSLRPYLAGLLLSLADHPDHPFRPIAIDEGQMLALLALSHDRDSQSHGGGSDQATTASTAQQHAQTAQSIVRILLKGI